MNRIRAIVSLLCVLSLPLMAAADAANPAEAARADIKSTFGFVPGFLQAVPDSALPGAWEEMKMLQMNPNTALPPKIKELIGLAVASQIPCKYCIYTHTAFAKLDGATDTERGEAVIMAALARHWSTVLQGNQTDIAKFKGEIATAMQYAKDMMAGKMQPPAPVTVTDAASAQQEIKNNLGVLPDFLRTFPPAALPGAWKEMRDVEMSPKTALSDKHKSLIGLAVSSQIPCRFCIHADTQFAKLAGATDAEVSEAIAMAALTRHWSTVLNGLMIDEKAFNKDIDRIVKGAKKQMDQKSKLSASLEGKGAGAAHTDKHPTVANAPAPTATH